MTSSKTQPPKVEHADDFISAYANYLTFEPTAWDFKMVFGQVEQVSGTDVVKQKMAVTIPWPQAKLALYYLRVHVEAAEMQIGKIAIRKDVVPPELPPLTPEQKADPDARKLHELVQRLRAQFIASL
jgi:hypothetical protein